MADRLKTVIYAKEGESSSSTYYRVLQFRRAMESAGSTVVLRALVPGGIWRARYDLEGRTRTHTLHRLAVRALHVASTFVFGCAFMVRDSISGPSCLVVVRSLLPHTMVFPAKNLYKILLSRSKYIVWDFDDDIFASGEISLAEKDLLTRNADRILVTHGGLAALLSESGQVKSRTLATTDGDFLTLNFREVMAERTAHFPAEIRLVWIGSSSGLKDLEYVAPALDAAARNLSDLYHKRTVLEVVCNLPFQFEFSNLELRNTLWSRRRSIDAVKSAHIGIMPLRDSEFARGKGGFKLVQYMAGALPSIASAVGFNVQVVDHGTTGLLVSATDPAAWASAVEEMAVDLGQWQRMSNAAHQRYWREFSYQVAADVWTELAGPHREI